MFATVAWEVPKKLDGSGSYTIGKKEITIEESYEATWKKGHKTIILGNIRSL